MRFSEGLAAALHLFVVLFFFLASALAFALSLLPELRFHLFHRASHASSALGWIGALFALSGVILLTAFYLSHRGSYLRIRMGKQVVFISSDVIQKAVEECWRREFKTDPPKTMASVIGNEVEVTFFHPPFRVEQQEAFYRQLEKGLTPLFQGRFGYERPFTLRLIF